MFQLSEEKESLLARLYYDAKWKQPTDMESVLEDFDLEEIVNQILSESDHSDPKYKELLDQVITILNYMDEDTEIPVPIEDELYDDAVQSGEVKIFP